ncbi:MAG: nucleoside 2-deoxyribosyltransferase [Fibromonadaceae bacterium]|jgi:nucleoside 2-deoxyribosyltransferase|nr:nucleoside 2-deoxyribosyltransferase [Fibromonadaceae bacterium]
MEIKKIFVATPIGKDGSKERIHSDAMFNQVFESLEKELDCKFIRIDEQPGIGIVSEKIYKGIEEADVVIADTKWRNPNVFYEIGLAHALNKPVILMNPKEKKLPFDLAHF